MNKTFLCAIFIITLLSSMCLTKPMLIAPGPLELPQKNERYTVHPGLTISGSSVSILLDSSTGRTWRYFLFPGNDASASKQGWAKLYFFSSNGKKTDIPPYSAKKKKTVGRYVIYKGFSIARSSVPILLDTATGENWRYFMNLDSNMKMTKEGWENVIFY